MTISPSIDLGQIATIFVAIFGGIWFAASTLASVRGVKDDIGRFEEILNGQADELKKITSILVTQAQDGVRLTNVEAEIARLRVLADATTARSRIDAAALDARELVAAQQKTI